MSSSLPALFSLSGRRAVVTGASRGLGRAIAVALADAGASVALLARDGDALDDVATEITAIGGTAALVIPVDVTDSTAVRAAFAKIDDWGEIDLLVSNVGTNIRKPTLDATDDDWHHVQATNLHSSFYCAREAGRRMVDRKSGSIVFVGSVAGVVAMPTGVAYAASKGALGQMTRSLAQEWGPHGIRVNCVAPWYFKTPLTERLLGDPAYVDRILRVTPLRRIGRPAEDLAPVVVFLASDAAAYITGQVLAVDGGMSTSTFHP